MESKTDKTTGGGFAFDLEWNGDHEPTKEDVLAHFKNSVDKVTYQNWKDCLVWDK